jgi:Xaa-Pro aminopeptidase
MVLTALPDMDFSARRARLREAADLDDDTGFLVTDLTNIRYLCGFDGSAATLLVLSESAVLLTDNRYAEVATELVAGGDLSVLAGDRAAQWPNLSAATAGLRKLLFEATQVTVDQHDQLREHLPALELVRSRAVVEGLRLVKDEGEIARIAAATDIAAAAFEAVREPLERGASERDLALALERRMVDLGAEAPAFASIVAGGPNASRPHAHPGERRVAPGELVVFDFGARVDGYACDVSRTIWYGELSPDLARLHAGVTAANAAGIQAARAGATHAAVEAACLQVLREHGFPGPPTHPAGHNIGLAVHELPYLTRTAAQELMAGQVLAVEPGVYLPGRAGVRVEDTVVVGADTGPRVLSAAIPGRLAPG